MKLFRIAVVSVVLLCAGQVFAAAPTWDERPPRGGSMYLWDVAASVFRAVTGTSDGAVYFADSRGRVATGTPYYANLSTSTPTLLSNIASWSAGDILEIQCNNVAFRSWTATTTAATVWKGIRVGQWDVFYLTPSGSSLEWDMSWVASTSAQASITVGVCPPKP